MRRPRQDRSWWPQRTPALRAARPLQAAETSIVAYVDDIATATRTNDDVRRVLHTGEHAQLVLMTLGSGEEIGAETHTGIEQLLRIETGRGKAVLDGQEHVLSAGSAVVVPAGAEHDVINTSSSEPLRLYATYSPPEHPDGTVHATKAEADAYEEAHHH